MNQRSLLSLPLELLHMVVKELQDDALSLSHLIQTCQLFHKIGRPVLYGDLLLENHQTRPFRDTIQMAPGLSDLVKSLVVYHHTVALDDLQDFQPLFAENFAPTIGKFKELKRLVLKGCGPDHPFTKPGCHERHQRIYNGAYARFDTLFKQAAKGAVLTKLETLNLNLGDVALWHIEIDPIMSHPSLKSLSILGASIAGLFQFHGPSHSTPLENLTLLCCDIDADTLAAMLSLPAALRSLTMKGATRTLPLEPKYVQFDRQPYIDAMEQQHKSLTHLDVDFWYEIDESHDPIDLHKLTKLRELTIRPRVLTGVTNDGMEYEELSLAKNTLAPTIERITFRDVDGPIPVNVQNMLVETIGLWRRDDSLPVLRDIIFENAESVEDASEDVSKAVTNSAINVTFQDLVSGGRFPLDCECCEYSLAGRRYPNHGLPQGP